MNESSSSANNLRTAADIGAIAVLVASEDKTEMKSIRRNTATCQFVQSQRARPFSAPVLPNNSDHFDINLYGRLVKTKTLCISSVRREGIGMEWKLCNFKS